jgi:NAD(P)-dependent dehydrogenase (short-subunit alcohol dehydrogenase family)
LTDGWHRNGLKIVLADVDTDGLHTLGREIAAEIGEHNVLVIPTDVSSLEQVQRLKDKTLETFGEVRTDPLPPLLRAFFAVVLFWRNFGQIGELTSEHVLVSRWLSFSTMPGVARRALRSTA